MAVVSIDVKARGPYADGRKFEPIGAYERIDGTLHYEVDPDDKHNSSIVDLANAPRHNNGSVRFSGDFSLITPVDRPPRCLLVDVPNRGNRVAFRMFNGAQPSEVTENPCPVGDGFLFRHGFAVLSVGWQFDAIGLKLNVPDAQIDAKPLRGDVICQVQLGRTRENTSIGQLGSPSYKVHAENGIEARLYVRSHTHAKHELVDRSNWKFGRIQSGKFEDSTDHIWLNGGFQAGQIYTLVYPTQGAPVVGLGLLALRDAGSYFRSNRYPGRTAPPSYAIAFGASQTGRVLRHLIYEGLNVDEANEDVFDGFLPHIAGGQRGDFNHRFAQPSSMGVPACGQLFPFAGRNSTDTLTSMQDGLLRNLTSRTKVISTNTSWEYWRGDAALVHVSTDGTKDIPPAENERVYMFAGTHHINAVLPLTDRFGLTNERVRYPMNTVSYTPLIRAALLNLLTWIAKDGEPPDSKMPTLQDRTLVSRGEVIDCFRDSGKFEYLPDPDVLTGLSTIDLGPLADQGICSFPARQGPRYASLVSSVGADLNEVAGIRLPDIVVPLGVHSGWNPRHSDHGAPDQTAAFAGFSVFEPQRVREFDRSSYVKTCESVIDRLIEERFVLAEDKARLSRTSALRYDIASTIND